MVSNNAKQTLLFTGLKKLVKIPHLAYEFIQSLSLSLIWMFGSKIKVGNTEFQMRLRTFLFRSRMPTKVCSNNFLYLLWRQVLTSGRVLLTNRARLEVSSSKLMIRDQPSSSFWTFDQQFREMAASLSSIPPRPNALAEISNKRRSKCIISFFLEWRKKQLLSKLVHFWFTLYQKKNTL